MSSRTPEAKGRKWIARKIAELNVETDFTEIVRPATLYHSNDFLSHWGFVTETPLAGINPVAIDQVWRGGNSTSGKAPLKRMEDSPSHVPAGR